MKDFFGNVWRKHLAYRFDGAHKETGMPKKAIKGLYKMLQEDFPGGRIRSSNELEVQMKFPQKIAGRLFDKLDLNGDQEVSFKEVITLIAKLQNEEERLKWIFQFIDADYNGHLTRAEAQEFLDAAGSPIDMPEPKFMKLMTLDVNPTLSLEEFVQVAQGQPLLVELFTSTFAMFARS